jgi:ascorbate-specific PTS system EIIC-type component UlaA
MCTEILNVCVFSDGFLDLNEFNSVCRALFRNDKGKIYCMEPKKLQNVFSVFDRNKVCYKCVFNIIYLFIYLFILGRTHQEDVSVMQVSCLYLLLSVGWTDRLVYFLLLSVGWTDRQRRVCILLE